MPVAAPATDAGGGTVDITKIQHALAALKAELRLVIENAGYDDKSYPRGLEAKTAFIRTGRPINRFHELVKADIQAEFTRRGVAGAIYPEIGASQELTVFGHIKKKDQDVVVLAPGDELTPELLTSGPMAGQTDPVGEAISNRAIIVGVRSQLSSVDKNFDTLMERAFAEPLNLHLRLPSAVLGELYVLPVYELEDKAMKEDRFDFKATPVSIGRFISTFSAITGRSGPEGAPHMVERAALVLTDLRQDPPIVYGSGAELKEAGLLPDDFDPAIADGLMPQTFGADLVEIQQDRMP